jgi:hypothetical protein
MRRQDIHTGMILYAYTSLWGEYLIRVTEITNNRPARVYGLVEKILRPPCGKRASTPMFGKMLDVGIICVKPPTPEQLIGV